MIKRELCSIMSSVFCSENIFAKNRGGGNTLEFPCLNAVSFPHCNGFSVAILFVSCPIFKTFV